MRIFHIILWKFTAILLAALGDRVFNEFLLQEQVSGVGDIRKNHLDVGIHPPAAIRRGDAFRFKFTLGLKSGLPIKEVLEDATDDGGFFRLDDQLVAFPTVAVDAEVSVRDALFHALANAPFHVVAEAGDFLLCKGCQQGHHNLAVAGERIDVFLLESDLDAQLFQVSDGLKQVDRVSGKAGNGLRKDDVYLSGLAVVEHPLEFFSLGCLCAGDAVICVDPNILPFGICLNQFAVIADLS